MKKLLIAAAAVAATLATPALAQSSSAGAVAPNNQDVDNRPNLQTMQTIGGDSKGPGVNTDAPVASGSGAAGAATRSRSTAGGGQDQRCAARWQALVKRGEARAQDQPGFLKTCMADVNPIASLPPPR